MECTPPPISISNWTYPMCVACKHATQPTVSTTWQHIGSRRWEQSAGIWKQAPLSNIQTTYVLLLAVSNAGPEAIVETWWGGEDVIKATTWSYCSLTVRLVVWGTTSLEGAGGGVELAELSRADLNRIQLLCVWPSCEWLCFLQLEYWLRLGGSVFPGRVGLRFSEFLFLLWNFLTSWERALRAFPLVESLGETESSSRSLRTST